MKGKRVKLISFLLVLVILTSLLPTAFADETGICFVATNDELEELSVIPSFINGVTYVPSKVFSFFGIYYNYFQADNTAQLYTSSKQIFFNLTTGESYDSFGTYYPVSATMTNGAVYVPASWVSSYFGLTYSYIKGKGYGDIVRIKDSSVILSDSLFLDGATSLMLHRYNKYIGAMEPPPPPKETPTASKEPQPDRRDTRVSLCFIGLPSSDYLDTLSNSGLSACFFLTADQIDSSPDTVRMIYGSGHSLGIYSKSSPDTECKETLDSFFDAAQIRPMMMASSSDVKEEAKKYAAENALSYLSPTIAISPSETKSANVISQIERTKSDLSITLQVNSNTEKMLPYILQFLTSKHYSVLPLRETYI